MPAPQVDRAFCSSAELAERPEPVKARRVGIFIGIAAGKVDSAPGRSVVTKSRRQTSANMESNCGDTHRIHLGP